MIQSIVTRMADNSAGKLYMDKWLEHKKFHLLVLGFVNSQ